MFQAKDVNHKLDGAGWTTTLAGVMRTSLQQVFEVQSEEYRKLGPDIKNKGAAITGIFNLSI